MVSGNPEDFEEWSGGKIATSEKANALGIIGGGVAHSSARETTVFVTQEQFDKFWNENRDRAGGYRDAVEGYTVLGDIG